MNHKNFTLTDKEIFELSLDKLVWLRETSKII